MPLFLKDFYFMFMDVLPGYLCDYIHAEPTEAQKRSNPPRTELFMSCCGGTRNIKHWPSGKTASTLSH